MSPRILQRSFINIICTNLQRRNNIFLYGSTYSLRSVNLKIISLSFSKSVIHVNHFSVLYYNTCIVCTQPLKSHCSFQLLLHNYILSFRHCRSNASENHPWFRIVFFYYITMSLHSWRFIVCLNIHMCIKYVYFHNSYIWSYRNLTAE